VMGPRSFWNRTVWRISSATWKSGNKSGETALPSPRNSPLPTRHYP
jgi:hypothetical protein